MLPPRHSVTLKPSSFSSPVNSKLTPPRRELVSEWMRIHAVSSLMMVPKLRVLRPEEDVRVLLSRVWWAWREAEGNVSVKTYFPCMGSQIQATGWPDFWTIRIWFARWFSIYTKCQCRCTTVICITHLPSTVSSDQGDTATLLVWVHDWENHVSQFLNIMTFITYCPTIVQVLLVPYSVRLWCLWDFESLGNTLHGLRLFA